MSRPRVLASLLAALVVAFAVVLMNHPSGTLDGGGSPASRAPEAAPSVHAGEATSIDSGAEPQRRTVATSHAPSPEPEPGEQSRLRVSGTITVRDANGEWHDRESGSLVMAFWEGNGGSGHGVEVTAGRFAVRVPADRELGVSRIELGGRVAVPDGIPARYRVEDGMQIELRARWVQSTLLHVIDAETKRELSDVTVVRALGWPRSDLRHPGDHPTDRIVIGPGVSPLEIPPGDGSARTFHVGAPGRAWERVQFEGGGGGERFVELGPAGDLDVALLGDLSCPGLVLRVRGTDQRLIAEVDVATRASIELEGLPVGELDVAAEVGDWWDGPRVLGRTTAALRTGLRTHVDLRLEALAVPDAVPFGGEVVLPASWALERFLLVVQLLDPVLAGQERVVRIGPESMTRVSDEVWRWHLDAVQPGRYELELFPLCTSIVCEVGPAGLEDCRFELPPPGEVSVRVLDASNGRPATVDAVFWRGEWPEGVHGGGLARAEIDATTGLWNIRAPCTDIVITTRSDEFRTEAARVHVTDVPRGVTMQALPSSRIDLVLRDGEIGVPWTRGTAVSIRAPGDDAWRPIYVPGGVRLSVRAREPGRYRVRVSELPGYLPLGELVVDVPAPGVVEHPISLTRAR